MSKRETALLGFIACGLASLTYGAGLAWPPLWWIVGGLAVIGLAVLALVEV